MKVLTDATSVSYVGHMPTTHQDEFDFIADRPAAVSRVLFMIRESLEMWRDVVEIRSGAVDVHTRDLIKLVDAYRAAHGWSPYGFGGESDDQ